jgi:hypothetical protein
MTMAMTRAQFPKSLQDGVNTFFGMEYDSFDTQYDKIFDSFNSQKAYEEDVLQIGLGAATVKAEGGVIQYDSGQEGWVARYVNVTIAHAFAITEEAVEDGRYGDISSKYARSMARGMRYTKEVRGISILNNGFDANFAGGDAKPLFAVDHPLAGGGVLGNVLPVAADLSEEALEDAMIAIDGFVDDRGIPVQAKAKRLIVPRQLQFIAARLLQSTKQSGTANNDINALREAGALPDGTSVNTYLSDPDAWYLKTNVADGLKTFTRRKLKKGMEGDFETGNMRYKASERYSFGWTDPRGAFASAGA